MAVPVSSDLFNKHGIARVNYAVPQLNDGGHCCLHGSSCRGDSDPHFDKDQSNSPAELRMRVKSYLNSKHISEDETSVYKTIMMLLATVIFHDEAKNEGSVEGGTKKTTFDNIVPAAAGNANTDLSLGRPLMPRGDSAMSRSGTGGGESGGGGGGDGGRRKSISDDLVLPEMKKTLFFTTAMPKVFIHPSSPGRLTWDLASLFIVLIDSIILPFQLAYYDNVADDAWFWFGTAFFTCDICLNFITGYVAGPLEHDHGQLVIDKTRIARWYLKSWFIIDFVSTVPWNSLFDSGEGGGTRAAKAFKVAKLARFLRLARMLKLLKLQDLWQKLENVVGSMFVVQALQLLRVLALVIYVCHWNACIWWVIGSPVSIIADSENGMLSLDPHWTTRVYHQTFRNDEGEEFIRKFRWIDNDIPRSAKYAFCFYWTLGVMRTMPQEAFPTNTLERLYTLGFMFFAFSMFSICITKITQMFNKINLRRQEFNEHMAHVRSYMHENDVDSDLRDRIGGYLEHRFNRRRIFAKELGLFNELSESLRIEVRCAQLAPAIASIWLFEALTEQEIKKVVTICGVQDFAPGDIVSQHETIAMQSHILISGRMTMVDPQYLKRLSPQELNERMKEGVAVVACDIECLLLDQPTVAERSVWAMDYSEVLVIYKQDFLDLRKLNPSIDQHVKMLQNSNRGLAIREKTFGRMSFFGGDDLIAEAMKNMANGGPQCTSRVSKTRVQILQEPPL